VKKIGVLAWAVAMCACAQAAMAQDWQSRPPMTYPDPPCVPPDLAQIMPPPDGDVAEARIYNFKVKAFNKAMDAYNSCIHTYVDNANRDMATIKDRANADLKRISNRANASLKIVEDKIGQALAQVKAIADAQQSAMDSPRATK
jgi:hypothetical protein